MSRFINADTFVTTGTGLLGNNMFAYCNNNPIAFSDPAGHAIWGTNTVAIADGYCGFYPGSAEYAVKKLRRHSKLTSCFELIANTDEQVVLDAEYFSFYKGVPVIRTNMKRSGSFGIIFLARNTNAHDCPEDMVRHEYGHTKQLTLLGPIDYLLCIVLPSYYEWGSNTNYYERPWEITADIFGGVTSRNHPAQRMHEGLIYLVNSYLYGALSWLTIE